MKILNLYLLFICLSLFVSSAARADTAVIGGFVNRMLMSETDYGGCMVLIDQNVQDVLPACRANWVSLSCDGSYLSSNVSKRLLESVQIAYALNQRAIVYVDDSRRVNGYCLGYRVDLVQ